MKLYGFRTSFTWTLLIIIDLIAQTLAYTSERKERVLKAIQACLDSAAVTPRQILGVAGQINSLALVLGPKALIDTKIFYKEVLPFITNRFSWGKSLHISTTLRDALFAWQQFILDFCGFRSFASKGSPIVVFSDASAVSSGAFIAAPRDRNSKDKFLLPEQGSAKDICLRSWSSEEKSLSSTWRELKIVEEALRAFTKQLKGKEVHWFFGQPRRHFSGAPRFHEGELESTG